MKNIDTIHVVRLFLAWQDEAEENWLREMSKQGLHLHRAQPFGSYTFERGEPREYIYRLDFRNELNSSLQGYYQLFQEAGWEHVGVMGGWQYWRKPYDPNQGEEIFSDPDSKIEKYKRLIGYMIVPLILISSSTFNLLNLNSRYAVWFLPFLALVFVLVIYSLVKVYQRIQELKRL